MENLKSLNGPMSLYKPDLLGKCYNSQWTTVPSEQTLDVGMILKYKTIGGQHMAFVASQRH